MHQGLSRARYGYSLFVALMLVGSAALQAAGPALPSTYVPGPAERVDQSHLEALSALSIAAQVAPDAGTVVQRAPAPALTALVIAYVYSTNVGGWEVIGSSQISTFYDHGGAQMRVITDELGYGNNPIARMLGAVLPSSANITTQPICSTSTGALTLSCTAGQTIVGWRRYWRLDGYQSGNFSYQNTSTNSPFNTLSDALTIR